MVTFRSRSNLISKKSTLIVELIRAETRVNILISGGVRAWTFPGPWRVQRERVSRSVMFATLWFLLVSWPLSQRWPTLYVERFLFKDEHMSSSCIHTVSYLTRFVIISILERIHISYVSGCREKSRGGLFYLHLFFVHSWTNWSVWKFIVSRDILFHLRKGIKNYSPSRFDKASSVR